MKGFHYFTCPVCGTHHFGRVVLQTEPTIEISDAVICNHGQHRVLWPDAVGQYAEGRISFGKCRELLGWTYQELFEFRARNRIIIPDDGAW